MVLTMARFSSLFLLASTASSSFVTPASSPKLARFLSTTTTFMSSAASTTKDAAATAIPEVKVGDKIPADITLMELVTGADKPESVNLGDLFKGKKVAMFGVPGAFTPGCSKSHLPSFITAQDDLKAKGVQETICVATNDAFVMEAWGRTSGGSDAGIRFLSDGNGELTKKLGLAKESPVMLRTKRFSLIAQDGVVTHYFSSDAQASDTWAPNVLSAL